VRGEIPPWTLVDDELFTVVPDATVTLTAIASATRRTVQIVELLHLRSGTPVIRNSNPASAADDLAGTTAPPTNS
jgi:hypothetical protein